MVAYTSSRDIFYLDNFRLDDLFILLQCNSNIQKYCWHVCVKKYVDNFDMYFIFIFLLNVIFIHTKQSYFKQNDVHLLFVMCKHFSIMIPRLFPRQSSKERYDVHSIVVSPLYNFYPENKQLLKCCHAQTHFLMMCLCTRHHIQKKLVDM